ncbi:MAG: DNA recombination protein RmuC [Nitrospirae bacterium]|nr:DNA recombination protein RmuC [Candidatus Manganitrophaceae bacterium]
MEMALLALLGIVVVLLLVLIARSFKAPSQDGGLFLMQQQVDQLRQQLSEALAANTGLVQQQLSQITTQVNNQLQSVNQQLTSATGQIGSRLDNAARVVGEVKQNLGELTKATQQVYEVGKNISSLQEILRAPKLRGSLGELFLGELLSQVLPPTHFILQHRFKSNEAVDAVIILGPALVSVDSKFPLENFKKMIETSVEEEKKSHRKRFLTDVKKHIDSIAGKYILPDEGTYDFALMYIPAENVYYETIIKDEAFGDEKSLCSYALTKRVIPVSPNSFYAYLQAIVLGFRGLRIEKSAQEIHQRLQRLSGDFFKFKEDFDVIGKHLSNTRGRYEEASKKLDRFGDRLITIDHEAAEPKVALPKEELARPALFD